MASSKVAYEPVRSSPDGGASGISLPSPSSPSAAAGEGAEGLLREKPRARGGFSRQRLCTSGTLVVTLLNAALFSASLVLFLLSRSEKSILNAGLRQASTFSPVFDRIDLEMRPRFIQGTLFPAREGASIARELPNPAADGLWEEWELSQFYPLAWDEVVRMGKDPSTMAKLEDAEWGLGDDAYVGTLDLYHQVHCLNMLRRQAYRGYYNLSERSHETLGLAEVHLNHCVDILLQALQCGGNVNFMTYHWIAGQEYPQPDMSVNRQCINFDKLTAWRIEKGLDLDKYVKVMKKSLHPGVKELHQSDAYYKYYNRTNPNHINGSNPGEDFNL
ncbi:hypothetical protein GGS23DRAFT_602848 [Durotheca rogersii]|uniref:uncharacterized protein n=1 Tax=Durotheca rogersii TaxID=419775 RepID=UPI002220BCB9|nr:uncharacterized protein GGS23DRAFT_602848 [Durotheca rogersii]KAI5866528.1 hypothetical protein GGS23DRAFT_602848 [Durotheca rogersii]